MSKKCGCIVYVLGGGVDCRCSCPDCADGMCDEECTCDPASCPESHCAPPAVPTEPHPPIEEPGMCRHGLPAMHLCPGDSQTEPCGWPSQAPQPDATDANYREWAHGLEVIAQAVVLAALQAEALSAYVQVMERHLAARPEKG